MWWAKGVPRMNFNISEMLTVLKGKRAQIVAETLASVAYDQLSKHFTDPLFEKEFVRRHLADTPTLAREVISLACHGLAGVTQTFSFSDGLVGEFSSRVLGNTLSRIAGKVNRSQTTIIDVDPANYRSEDLGQMFNEDVRALAVEKLTAKFENKRTGESGESSSFSKFLGGLNTGAKNFVGTAADRFNRYRESLKQGRSGGGENGK